VLPVRRAWLGVAARFGVRQTGKAARRGGFWLGGGGGGGVRGG
jgi:hypothetical protein